MKPKIIFLGTGICLPNHLTQESIEILKNSDVIYILETETGSLKKFLGSSYTGKIHSLNEMYKDGDIDENNYSRIESVIKDSANKFSKVVVCMPGHPRIGTTLVQRLSTKEVEQKFEVSCHSALSSFDTIICDLKKDPLERGSVILDVNRLLLFDLTIEPFIDYYIYHVCSIGNSKTETSQPLKGNRYDLLKAKLLKYYPIEHHIALISSSVSNDQSSMVRWENIGNIDVLMKNVHFGTTMFVPALAKPTRIDKNFLSLLQESGTFV